MGTSLLAECREWLAALGAEVMFVSAVDDEASAFYLTAGFHRCSGPWLWAELAVEEEP